MDFKSDFRFTSVSNRIPQSLTADPYAPIRVLAGKWVGKGFNQIWRPFFGTQDRFLELNETLEQLEFDFIPGDIPNRGFLQADINLHGLRYLQQIQDAHVFGPNNHPAGIHVEPGIWLTVPSTTNPANAPTLVRMGNIPHGTNFVAQGTDLGDINHAPAIPAVSITPFTIGNPAGTIVFPESTLNNPSTFRTPKADIPNVVQTMVDNPNSVLTNDLIGKTITKTTTFHVSTVPPNPPSSGGGEANIAFLLGGAPGNSPNALNAEVDCTFWIMTEELPHGKHRTLLQYSQRVLLNFNGLSWPHVSVATLEKQ